MTWRRLSGVYDWQPGVGYAGEARALRARFKDVVRRTYIIRNVAVHEAQTKASTRSVTLPLFADLVRVSLGHVLRYAGADGALAEVATRPSRSTTSPIAGRRTPCRERRG